MNRYFKIHFIAIFISVLFLGAMLTVTPANAMGRFWPLPNPEPPPVEEPPVPGDTSCPNPIPTLLIHGFLGNPSNMEPLERYLIDNGWPQVMLSRPSIPNTSLYADFSDDVANAAQDLLDANPGYNQVDIVGYSRGGKNGLDYILSGGLVRNFVGMDAFLPTKPSPDQTPFDTLYYCIDCGLGSMAVLEGAVEVEIPMNHLMVWRSEEVWAAIADGLRCNGTNN